MKPRLEKLQRSSVQLSERLASLGIMGDQLSASPLLKSLEYHGTEGLKRILNWPPLCPETIWAPPPLKALEHHGTKGVKGILNCAPIMPRDVKESASLRYFDTCFMHNIGRVSDRWWHDSPPIKNYVSRWNYFPVRRQPKEKVEKKELFPRAKSSSQSRTLIDISSVIFVIRFFFFVIKIALWFFW